MSGRASRLKNASLAEASLGLSRLQKERAHGWRGGPRQSRDERRFVYVLPHRCSKWATRREPREGDNQGRTHIENVYKLLDKFTKCKRNVPYLRAPRSIVRYRDSSPEVIAQVAPSRCIACVGATPRDSLDKAP
jgi:hypothetical protein